METGIFNLCYHSRAVGVQLKVRSQLLRRFVGGQVKQS